MSEREMRRLLQDVIQDIDAGRVDVRPRRRQGPGRLRRLVAPPLIAASLGLGLGAAGSTGCDGRNVGTAEDGGGDASAQVDSGNIEAYGVVMMDAGVDGGNVDLYGVIVEDGGVQQDAIVDAAVDGEIPLPYAAPPILDYPLPA